MSNHILPHVCDNEKHLEELETVQYAMHRISALLGILNSHLKEKLEILTLEKEQSSVDIESLFIFTEVLCSIAEEAKG